MKRILIVWSTVTLVAAAVACSEQSPARPSETLSATVSSAASTATGKVVTDALTGVTLTTPIPSAPNDNQAFKFTDQPITLTVKNAVTTGSTPLTYSFQVTFDAAFTSLAFTQDGVPQGANGQTSLAISKKLAGATTYFWRSRVSSGTLAGLFSQGRSFAIGPEIILQPTVPASPAQDANVAGNASLVVNNIQRSGPVTQIIYQFDLGDSSSFSHIVFSQSVPEQPGSQTTSVSVPATLPAGTYFWHVSATDSGSGLSTGFSAPISFTFQPFDLCQATIVDSPYDLCHWTETAKITSVSFNPDNFIVDFDKRTGPDRWLDTPFGNGSLEYTLGLCLNIRGHWYCSAVVQYWFERNLGDSGEPRNVYIEWFYDPIAWGPMHNYQPATGETVGIFVMEGNGRHKPLGDASYQKERSNVAFVQWSNEGGVDYTFLTGRRATIAGPRVGITKKR